MPCIQSSVSHCRQVAKVVTEWKSFYVKQSPVQFVQALPGLKMLNLAFLVGNLTMRKAKFQAISIFCKAKFPSNWQNFPPHDKISLEWGSQIPSFSLHENLKCHSTVKFKVYNEWQTCEKSVQVSKIVCVILVHILWQIMQKTCFYTQNPKTYFSRTNEGSFHPVLIFSELICQREWSERHESYSC